MEEQSSEGQSSEGERQSEDEQLAGDAEQKQAGPTGPGSHTIENELAEGQLVIQQLFRSSERFTGAQLGARSASVLAPSHVFPAGLRCSNLERWLSTDSGEIVFNGRRQRSRESSSTLMLPRKSRAPATMTTILVLLKMSRSHLIGVVLVESHRTDTESVTHQVRRHLLVIAEMPVSYTHLTLPTILRV